jgi:hypothetical protein
MAAPSITSSARNRNAPKFINPIALAALRFSRLTLSTSGLLPDRITENGRTSEKNAGYLQDFFKIVAGAEGM